MHSMQALTRDEAAYIAGILDADGMVGKVRRKKGVRLTPVISITKTDKRIIDWFAQRFPGKITYREPSSTQKKPFWVLRISDRAVVRNILREVLPFMVLKREQTALVLRLIEAREGKGMGDHYTENELQLSRQFVALST